MAITLVHRYESGNTTDVPSSLVRGEIALNTQNGKLWFGNNSGATSSAWNLGPTLRIGRTLDTTQEDNMLIFDGHAQDFRMGIDDSSDLLRGDISHLNRWWQSVRLPVAPWAVSREAGPAVLPKPSTQAGFYSSGKRPRFQGA